MGPAVSEMALAGSGIDPVENWMGPVGQDPEVTRREIGKQKWSDQRHQSTAQSRKVREAPVLRWPRLEAGMARNEEMNGL